MCWGFYIGGAKWATIMSGEAWEIRRYEKSIVRVLIAYAKEMYVLTPGKASGPIASVTGSVTSAGPFDADDSHILDRVGRGVAMRCLF